MKILELRFKNLNSLYGEWVIDFTHPEYRYNGIFALTGPTGAGKSTILDAICLALYGATPRLGKITKSGNEILSRQTGECYAEVVFESQAGRFRCHWEQRRAMKKPEGQLQAQEHQIADADTGKLLETKKSRVAGVVEAKTGMDFERFTRSILLAQGGFDSFLKANVEQKSKILEQITGTEIYTQISGRVHERQRDEREKLNILNAETSGIILLEPEQEQEIQDSLGIEQKKGVELTEQSAEIDTAITWLMTIDKLKKEILSLTDETAKLNADNEAFKPQRSKLKQALKAASLEAAHAGVTVLRQQQADDRNSLKVDEAALPELEVSASKQAKALQAAKQLTQEAKQQLAAATPLIQKIRLLDQTIADQTKAVSEATVACAEATATIAAGRQNEKKARKKRMAAMKKRQTAERYLEENAGDEWLVGGLTGIEAQFGNLLDQQRKISHKATSVQQAKMEVVNAEEQLEKAHKQYTFKEQALKSAGEELQQGKVALSELLDGKHLREYRAEKESLLREMALIRKIEALEVHRSKLEDGKPCPLCGSSKHPFAEGNVPISDDIEQNIDALTELIAKAEHQEAAVKQLEQAEITAHNRLSDMEKDKNNAANDKKTAERIFAELQENCTKLRADFETLKQTVSAKLQRLGITEIAETAIKETLYVLKSRLKAWQEQVKQQAAVEVQITAIDSELERLNAVIETQTKALTEKQDKLEQLKQAFSNGTEQRKQWYGDKQPDAEEARLNKVIADAETATQKADRLNTEWQQQLTAAKTQIKSLKQRIAQRTPELTTAETTFSLKLTALSFADEQAFLKAGLSHAERESLSLRAGELDNAKTELAAKQQDRELRLTTELAKKCSDKSPEELQSQWKAIEASLRQSRETIAALKHRLSENTAAKARIQEKQHTIEAQKKECRRWEKLHGLIGSADGKKYRNFAQGLTFELMVAHANQQLKKMTDRYLLIRDGQQPLALNVIDNYQAGEIRSTKNLSGGESFIVSLTLALGLSKMASRKVRVDSLFLDEGFGTLDENALETALETLSGLQQDGKLIGIISHVTALKERISTQINITPVSGGRSSLSGPGVQKW